jgi:hypothetical protein
MTFWLHPSHKRARYSRRGQRLSYFNGKVEIESSEESKDEVKQTALWKASLDFVDLNEGDFPLDKKSQRAKDTPNGVCTCG